jgi:thioredoxin reductase (NADPH)
MLPSDPDTLFVLGLGLGLAILIMAPMFLRTRRRERDTAQAEHEAIRQGLHEPVSLHPVIDTDRCIGTSNCVDVCPEGVLGMRDGQAVAVTPARCIGHGLCERACPMEAIQLVFGTEKRGIDLPRVKENFETNVRGLYIVGELGGMGLVANAFEQGRQCVEGIVKEEPGGPPAILDLLIVGCGPGGLSASLHAKHAGLSFVTIEREDLGGTVRHYPRKKVVMTRPVKIPGWGKLPFREISKEELIESWEEIVGGSGLEVHTCETVTAIDGLAPHHFRVTTDHAEYESRRVILAIGRRGVPRRLGIPGEDSAHVYYSLRDPEAFADDRILVVGGGDSAVEAALALAEQSGAEVRMSYRGDAFSRVKPANHERIQAAIEAGQVEVLWGTHPVAIGPGQVQLENGDGPTIDVPADEVFVFIGGELPTAFLEKCGIETKTHFGTP